MVGMPSSGRSAVPGFIASSWPGMSDQRATSTPLIFTA